MIAESTSLAKQMHFYVIKNHEDDNYEIFFCTDMQHPKKQCDLFIVYFNNKHESLKEIQLDVDRKKFDFLTILGTASQPNGVLITVGLSKTVEYGRPDYYTPIVEGGSVYDHFISLYYIPKDSVRPKSCMIDLKGDVFPYAALYTYNPFAGALNSLLFSNHAYDYSFGLNKVVGDVKSCFFMKINEEDMSLSFNRIKDSIANSFLKQQTDTSYYFGGNPLTMFTNENGLSTLVSTSARNHEDPKALSLYNYSYSSQYIGITQFDDYGNELWGTVLPGPQSYWQQQQRYRLPVSGTNVCYWNKNVYIVYNDYNENFNNTLKEQGNPIYNYTFTNAFYYRVSSHREITKHYLFGPPQKHEYRHISQMYFDDKRGVYAALVSSKKNGKATLNMAWSHLE